MNLSLSSNSGLLVFIAPLVENFSSDKDLIVIVIGPKDILSEGVGVPPECGNIPVAPVDAFCSAAKCRGGKRSRAIYLTLMHISWPN